MSYKHNFKAVQLKFKLRSGILGLGCDLHREKRDDGFCKYCGAFESVCHFIFHCPAYMAERVRLYKGISIGIHDEIFNIFISDFALCALLGDSIDVFNTYLLFLEDALVLHRRF